MNDIYAIDSTRISLREYWWGSQSPLILVALLLKLLRVRIPSSTDDPNFASTLPWRVAELPPDITTAFQPLADELAALGFRPVAHHCFRDPGTQTVIYWTTFVHSSGRHLARIHHRRWAASQKVSRALFPVFLTGFSDGAFLVSSAGKPDMVTPASVRMNRQPRASVTALWARHQELAAAELLRTPLPAATEADALALTERHHELLRDFNLARGVFRPRTAQEQTQAHAHAERLSGAQAGGRAHPEVMAELERLQQHKPGWGNAIALLAVSLVAFLAAGSAQWDWKFTLWLIPVLLFHEAGHWFAMRIFGYRNLRMFFIPFFGAAVSGRHWNVPGWKKVLVSLAGPVPGIALGAGLVVLALLTESSALNQAALMLLILNGFNLLPVLPLDGGHVLQATLFCRHRWLDFGFRVLAVVVLVGLGTLGTGTVFYILGGLLAVGLPTAFRIGKVVDTLRAAPLPQPAPDDDRIPAATAEAIITELKRAQPAGVSDRIVAQQALGVFETLNARPPGALATLGLLATHAAAFGGALIFLVVLMAGRMGGGNGDALALAMSRRPVHEIRCDAPPRVWPAAAPTTSTATNRSLLVSTFPRGSGAEAAFAGLTNALPRDARLALVGQTLLLELPTRNEAARDRWLLELYQRNTNSQLAADALPVAFSFTLTAPDRAVATNLEAELRAFTAGAGAQLAAPWSPSLSAAERAAHRAAREFWLQLDRDAADHWSAPEMKELGRKLSAAHRANDTNHIAALTAERETLLRELARADAARLRAGQPHSALAPLVDWHARLAAAPPTAERAALLARVATALGAEQDDRRAASLGLVSRHGLVVELRWVMFNDALTALPELVDWLCRQGDLRIRYDLEVPDAKRDEDFPGPGASTNPASAEPSTQR